MDRRQFLRGTLISAAAGTGVIKFAKSAESSLLMPNHEVLLGHPSYEIPFFSDSPEVYARRADGAFVCIGVLKELTVRNEPIEVCSWDGRVSMFQGLRSGEITFGGRLYQG